MSPCNEDRARAVGCVMCSHRKVKHIRKCISYCWIIPKVIPTGQRTDLTLCFDFLCTLWPQQSSLQKMRPTFLIKYELRKFSAKNSRIKFIKSLSLVLGLACLHTQGRTDGRTYAPQDGSHTTNYVTFRWNAPKSSTEITREGNGV
jgi:hypothetical protein